MKEWHLTRSGLKKYPHFDPLITAEKGESYARDKERVAKHAFFPFIQYSQRWARFPKQGQKRPPKKRPIRYAARQDAYIFSYYRDLLSRCYEAELERLGLTPSILAYRQIPLTNCHGGKCNIHFARDAFLQIRQLGDCCAIALDISAYFESLDHARLKHLWQRLLGVQKLPADYFQVFKAITNYSWVEKVEAYRRLGHFGVKKFIGGEAIEGYLTPYGRIPKCLCKGSVFRQRISGGAQKSIIKKNSASYGIPQGAPISDLLANLYLIDFDDTVASWVRTLGGAYFRYSDDILILVPGDEAEGRKLMERTRELIGNFGLQLRIKKEKSSLLFFQQEGAHQRYTLCEGTQGRNGLEYLGFRFDGKRVYLRDATLSNFLRKVARAAYFEAEACARRYPDKDAKNLRRIFDYERLVQRFGKVEGFGELHREYRNWTFWTYAKRASSEFGRIGKPILRQLRRHRHLIRERADKAIERAVIRREKREALRRRQVGGEYGKL